MEAEISFSRDQVRAFQIKYPTLTNCLRQKLISNQQMKEMAKDFLANNISTLRINVSIIPLVKQLNFTYLFQTATNARKLL